MSSSRIFFLKVLRFKPRQFRRPDLVSPSGCEASQQQRFFKFRQQHVRRRRRRQFCAKSAEIFLHALFDRLAYRQIAIRNAREMWLNGESAAVAS